MDDVNTWAGTTDHELGVKDNTMYDLQQRSQGLTDLNEVGGGSTAFHKCACQFMSSISNGVTLEINILVDAKGAPSKIKMLACTKISTDNKDVRGSSDITANIHRSQTTPGAKIDSSDEIRANIFSIYTGAVPRANGEY